MCILTGMKKKKYIKESLYGICAGLVNGFFGSGGGILVLNGFLHEKIEQKRAHATAILAIAPLSLISAYFYMQSGSVVTDHAVPLLIGSGIGGAAGALLLKRIGQKVLELIFTGLILYSGIRMLF